MSDRQDQKPESSDQAWTLLGAASITEAERIKSSLAMRGTRVELGVNPGDCKGGSCGVRAEIWVQTSDLEIVQEFLRGEAARNYAGLEFNPEHLNAVYNPEAAEATCPACGTTFATSHNECPECGLSFGIG